MELLKSQSCFGGEQRRYKHISKECRGEMTFSLFLPPDVSRPPVLYWLSGLTCTDENFVIKAGAQRVAAELGLAIVCPDTSPRGSNHPGEHDSYDFGSGAGFYVDATEAPWSENYRMYSYVTKELPAVLDSLVDHGRAGVFGHSMGGHGALVMGLREPQLFQSISAFAPICAPSETAWGEKAFARYLGTSSSDIYDASRLLSEKTEDKRPILVDQGLDDEFLNTSLRPETLQSDRVELRKHVGYDHSYFFIATFIEDHLRFHHKIIS